MSEFHTVLLLKDEVTVIDMPDVDAVDPIAAVVDDDPVVTFAYAAMGTRQLFPFLFDNHIGALLYVYGFEPDSRIAWLRYVIRRLEELVNSLEIPRRGPHVRYRI